MSCKIEELTDSRISSPEKWIIEKIYCAPYVYYYNFVEKYLFTFNQSLMVIIMIIALVIFLYLRLNKVIFKSLFINQLFDFLEDHHLIETEISLYFFSLPILTVFIIAETFEYQVKRPMNNLVFSNSIILMSMPIIITIILVMNDRALKVMKNATMLTLFTIIGFVVLAICGLVVGVINYYLVVAAFLLFVTYTVLFGIMGRRDKNFEIMTHNGYDREKIEQVYFYPEEVPLETNVYSRRKETALDLASKSRLTNTRLEIKISSVNPEMEDEMSKLSAIFHQELEKNNIKAKIIEELEEELKDEDSWFVIERRKYIDDADLSTYALDNLITYVFIIFLVLTVPSHKNPLVVRGLKVIPLTLGAIAFLFNISYSVNIIVFAIAIAFVMLYYSFKACMSENSKAWLDNMIFFFFIWCFILNVVNFFFDFSLFIQFFYDFTEAEADAIKGIVFGTPLIYLTYALIQKKRSVLAFTITISLLTQLAIMHFAVECFWAIQESALLFDIKTVSSFHRSASFLIPIQLLLLTLLSTILLIFFSVTDYKTKKVISVCSLIISIGYIVSVYSVSLIH